MCLYKDLHWYQHYFKKKTQFLLFKNNLWQLVIINIKYLHKLVKDLFNFKQHKDKNLNKSIII